MRQGMELRVTVLCGIVVVLEGYDLSALGYVVPTLSDAWGIAPAGFTAALTAGNVGMFVGALVCGWFGDRVGRKPMLVGSVALFGVASILTAYVTGITALSVARFATGVGLGGGIPLCIALVSDWTPKARQGPMVIAMISGVVVGNLLAGIVAALLLSRFGWPSIFVVGGVAPLLLLPVLLLFLPESPAVVAARQGTSTSIQPRNTVAALFQSGLAPATVLLWGINFLNLLTIYFVNSWLPAVLSGMGATPERAIVATSMFHVGAIIAAFVSGRLVGRFGMERVLAVMLALGGTCIALTGVLELTLFGLGCFILGFGFGTNGSQLGISALPGALYPPLIRSTGAGWATGFGRLGNIAGAILGGALLATGWTPRDTLIGLAVAPFLTAALMVFLRRTRQMTSTDVAAPAAVVPPR